MSRAFVFCLLLTGCGHQATVEECEEIVERIARLEIEERANLPKSEVEEEIETMKQALRDSTMKDCVGRRITESAMQCVRTSKTSKEVIDCFD